MSGYRLSISERRRNRPDIVLEFPEGEFPVRSFFGVTEIADFVELQDRLAEAESGRAQAEIFRDAYGSIMALVRERTPNAPDLVIEPEELMEILGAIASGGRTLEGGPQAEALDAITGGDADTAKARPGDGDSGDGSGPLASAKPSPKRSSRSARSTAGRPASGASSTGTPAGSTSSPAPVA